MRNHLRLSVLIQNRLANYVPTLPNRQPGGIMQVGQGISSPYPTNYNSVSPRVW